MATDKRTDLVTVGSADIYINGVDVGHLKERVEFRYTREKLPFKPANMLGNVEAFPISEMASITARTAQLNLANLKLALGVTTDITSSTTLTGVPASVSFTPSTGSSWDTMTLGGSKAERKFGVRVEHTRPNGKKFIVMFYKAYSNTELLLPFVENEFTLSDLVLEALADATRAEGDQIGLVADQVN
jgi:hypothetical protein